MSVVVTRDPEQNVQDHFVRLNAALDTKLKDYRDVVPTENRYVSATNLWNVWRFYLWQQLMVTTSLAEFVQIGKQNSKTVTAAIRITVMISLHNILFCTGLQKNVRTAHVQARLRMRSLAWTWAVHRDNHWAMSISQQYNVRMSHAWLRVHSMVLICTVSQDNYWTVSILKSLIAHALTQSGLDSSPRQSLDHVHFKKRIAHVLTWMLLPILIWAFAVVNVWWQFCNGPAH